MAGNSEARLPSAFGGGRCQLPINHTKRPFCFTSYQFSAELPSWVATTYIKSEMEANGLVRWD
eukprot:scaffold493318_cov41-Prasinocladus_malaysianus.AAC.1